MTATKMSRKNDEALEFDRVAEDYAPRRDVFSEEEHLAYLSKEALATLSPGDRELFILYAELGSYRETARYVGLSPSTLHYRIAKIRKKLKKKILHQ